MMSQFYVWHGKVVSSGQCRWLLAVIADPTKYFGCELGAQTQFDNKNDRYIVNGSHTSDKLQDLLDGFIRKFVLCPECDNPETNLVSKGCDVLIYLLVVLHSVFNLLLCSVRGDCWRRSIVVRMLVSAGELSLSCARLLAGWVTTLWLSRLLSVSQDGQCSHSSLRGQ